MRNYAMELQDLGYDVGEQCREFIDNYGNPCCDDSDEPDGDTCGMLDELIDLIEEAGLREEVAA